MRTFKQWRCNRKLHRDAHNIPYRLDKRFLVGGRSSMSCSNCDEVLRIDQDHRVPTR